MSDKKPKHRWFQYSLRSVLLLMLAVGVWLGYEVNWASRQQRHVAAIEELGGSVEVESCWWSLLRYFDRAAYGTRIVKAEIHGRTIPEAIPHLEGMRDLRRLRVRYDGSCDLYPHLDRLNAALPTVKITPVAEESPRGILIVLEDLSGEVVRRVTSRVYSKVRDFRGKDCVSLHRLAKQWASQSGMWKVLSYHLVPAADGTYAELLVVTDLVFSVPGSDDSVSVLLVRDRVVDWRQFVISTRSGSQDTVLEDFDGDGRLDVGFECRTRFQEKWLSSLPGDSRTWFDVCRITSNGFRSLLREHEETTSD